MANETDYIELGEKSLYADTAVYKISDDFIDNEPISQEELENMASTAKRSVYSVMQDKIVFGFMRRPLLPDVTDVIYTVDQATANKLSDISDMFYGTPQYWWALAVVNNIIDIHLDVVNGVRLRIPSQQRVAQLK